MSVAPWCSSWLRWSCGIDTSRGSPGSCKSYNTHHRQWLGSAAPDCVAGNFLEFSGKAACVFSTARGMFACCAPFCETPFGQIETADGERSHNHSTAVSRLITPERRTTGEWRLDAPNRSRRDNSRKGYNDACNPPFAMIAATVTLRSGPFLFRASCRQEEQFAL